MRLTSFLAGAVVGAAAISYMNRNNKSMMFGFSQLGDNVSKAVDKALINFADKNMSTRKENDPTSAMNSMMGSMTSTLTNNPVTNTMNASSTKGCDLDKVEQLASMDPEVQGDVNEILNQNNVSAH